MSKEHLFFQSKIIGLKDKSRKSRFDKEKNIFGYLDYIKQLNTAKRENQGIKDEMKKLNRSLGKLIKSYKSYKNKSSLTPKEYTEEDLNKKIQSTDYLVQKYLKEIEDIKYRSSTPETQEKLILHTDIVNLQEELKALESENTLLSKSQSHFKSISPLYKSEEKVLAKELLQLKEKQRELEGIIKEDEKIIKKLQKNAEKAKKNQDTNENENEEKKEYIDFREKIEVMKTKISKLEEIKKNDEAAWKTKIQELTTNIETKKSEVLELEEIFKNKDRYCRVKKMQIKAQQRKNRVAGQLKSAESDESDVSKD
ncbi:hypothetical protein SteCoe_7077 [Stentor coeruleus]|uniref:Uncharacterized protein n=1 Tax=Stentor coeruleus TaxID=5963 RepID=A0A1R2CNH8_9CILI|nr:hypothetical protein SteCoe_7077 [Stentor coeruleus]